MSSLRSLLYGFLVLVLVACGGYDDDGAPDRADGTSDATLQTTEFFLTVALGDNAAAARRADRTGKQKARALVPGLGQDAFEAEVLVPDINEPDGFREVKVDVVRFADLGEGLYSVEIDGIPQVDTLIYVTINNVRLKVLALRAGTRAQPIRVSLQTTAAVDLYLRQLPPATDLRTLDPDVVGNALATILTFIESVEIPGGLSDEEQIEFLSGQAGEGCETDAAGNAQCEGDSETFSVGGSVEGLRGTLILGLRGGEVLSVTASGAFAFNTALGEGETYEVSINSQPDGQQCSVAKGSGVIAGANITDVQVTCTDEIRYSVGGNASGLGAGSAVLILNGEEALTVTEGAFSFGSLLPDGAAWSVSLQGQPDGYTCELAGATGTLQGTDVDSVALNCQVVAAPAFSVGGSISGLQGSLGLALNGTESINLDSASSFGFSTLLQSGAVYSVVVTTQPAGQTCTVSAGAGTVADANISNVSVTCVTGAFTVGGTVSGAQGSFDLRLNGVETLAVSGGVFTFIAGLQTGESYSVTVASSPAGQLCEVLSGGSGTIATDHINSVYVSCSNIGYTVGGISSGLGDGSVVLQLNGGESLNAADGQPFVFETLLSAGDTYNVVVAEAPPGQTCTVSNGTGRMGTANVTNVGVACSDSLATVGVNLPGSVGVGMSIRLDYRSVEREVIPVYASGAASFASLLTLGEAFTLTIETQPVGQECTFDNGGLSYLTDTMGSTPQSYDISCISAPFTVGGSVSGLSVGPVLALFNGIEVATISTPASVYQFSTAVDESYVYAAVVQQVAGQYCEFNPETADTFNGNINNMNLVCAATPYSVDVTVTGMNGKLALEIEKPPYFFLNSQYERALVNVDGTFTFSMPFSDGDLFTVSVQQQPDDQVCTVTQSGSIAGSDALVLVNCAASSALPANIDINPVHALEGEIVTIKGNGLAGASVLLDGSINAAPLMRTDEVFTFAMPAVSGPGIVSIDISNVSGPAANPPPFYLGEEFAVTQAIAGGDGFTCFLDVDGQVRCSGSNFVGQLGVGSGFSESKVPLPVISGINKIVSGDMHVCALDGSDAVSCWGANGSGQLGNNSTNQSDIPGALDANAPAMREIAAGSLHTCGIESSGDQQVYCWGSNAYGQLGVPGPSSSLVPVPADVSLNGAVSLAAGGNHTCALMADQSVLCWGYNGEGQLGDGTFDSTSMPVAVSGLTNVVQVVAGKQHTCARVVSGSLYCWGANLSGQLGNGSTAGSNIPLLVSGSDVAIATEISAGWFHTCARNAVGDVVCWGDNSYGQAGDGSGLPAREAVSVAGVTGAQVLGAGAFQSCAATSTETFCWGSAAWGELGNGAARFEPAYAHTAPLSHDMTSTAQFSAGRLHSCAVLAGGQISCVGRNEKGQLGNGTQKDSPEPAQVSGVSDAVFVQAGLQHTCALLADATVKCWGRGDKGQLGDGSDNAFLSVPVAVTGLTGITSLSVGSQHSCAINNAKEVYCWGDNSAGNLGAGFMGGFRAAPVRVVGITSAVSVDATGAGGATCVVLEDGSMKCWGENAHGQLGNGSRANSAIPLQVAGIGAVSAMALGGNEGEPEDTEAMPTGATCAIGGGQLYCWGENTNGELGLGKGDNAILYPHKVSVPGTPVAVDIGNSHACALLLSGEIACWGDNSSGQAGQGYFGAALLPVKVPGITTAVAVSVADDYSCARLSGGDVMCWGSNSNAQMGSSLLPVVQRVRGAAPPP